MPAAKRVLFIGNSFTFFNGGMDTHLRGMAPGTLTEVVAGGGYTLEGHWNDGKAPAEIRKGKWDFVVLQEQSQRPVLERAAFLDYARKLDAEVRKSGGKTVLLMTWENAASGRGVVTTAKVADAYRTVGKTLGVTVAPAGEAFARALREKPTLPLYQFDGHPTLPGTYLATCVVYATIFGTSPVGNGYEVSGLSGELRGFLQDVAAKTMGL